MAARCCACVGSDGKGERSPAESARRGGIDLVCEIHSSYISGRGCSPRSTSGFTSGCCCCCCCGAERGRGSAAASGAAPCCCGCSATTFTEGVTGRCQWSVWSPGVAPFSAAAAAAAVAPVLFCAAAFGTTPGAVLGRNPGWLPDPCTREYAGSSRKFGLCAVLGRDAWASLDVGMTCRCDRIPISPRVTPTYLMEYSGRAWGLRWRWESSRACASVVKGSRFGAV